MGPRIVLRDVAKLFRRGNRQEPVSALMELSLEIEGGTFAAVVGPSGCGKTTLLRLLAGLETPTTGTVLLDEAAVRGVEKSVGLVFQKYPCFPWRTVRRNISFGLELTGAEQGKRERATDRLLRRVHLDGFGDELPGNLSGGMQQRVALARTLATEPALLLLDEPFGALDSATRHAMQELVSEYWITTGSTVVFVTHDTEEALLVADVVFVLSARPGRLVETLQVPFSRPRSPELRGMDRFLELEKKLVARVSEVAGGGTE